MSLILLLCCGVALAAPADAPPAAVPSGPSTASAAAESPPPRRLPRRLPRQRDRAEAAAETGDWAAVTAATDAVLARRESPRAHELRVMARTDAFVAEIEARRAQGLADLPASLPALQQLEAAMRELEAVAPGSVILGVAGATVQSARSPALLTVLSPACDAPARSHFRSAEAAFASGRFGDALAAYDAALARCPENSVWWTWSGDAALRTAGLDAALVRYEKALAIDRCNHIAQRFVADLGLRIAAPTGDEIQRSLSAALAAVACKPDYEPGWATLSGWAQLAGLQLVPGTLAAMDAAGLRTLQTAAALQPGETVLDQRVAALAALKASGPPAGMLLGLLSEIDDPALLRPVLAWETLDATTAADFRALRVEALPVLVEWIARTRLRPAAPVPPTAPVPVPPAPGAAP